MATSEVDSLIKAVKTGFAMISATPRLAPVLEQVKSLNQAYATLPRYRVSRKDLVELKFLMQHWRLETLRFALAQFSNKRWEDRGVLLEVLLQLNLPLSLQNRKQIAKSLQPGPSNAERDSLLELARRQRCQILLRAASDDVDIPSLSTPQNDLRRRILSDFKPVKASKWTLEKWARVESLKDFSRVEGEILFRGVRLRTGDIFATNLNTGANGVYTAPSQPESFVGHMGVFAMPVVHGEPCPCVIEIFQNGVRAVPLDAFFSDHFSTYVEIYRLPEIEERHAEGIHFQISKLMREIRGYNFLTDDSDRTFVNCTGVVNEILGAIGIEPIEAKSVYGDPMMNLNLGKLDYHCRSVLTPVDFAVDSRLSFVAVIDNGMFESEMAQFAVLQRLVQYYKRFELRMERLPLMFSLMKWSIEEIRRRSWIGDLIRRSAGFAIGSFPKGPAGLISLIELSAKFIISSARRIGPVLRQRIPRDSPFFIYSFLERVDVWALLTNACRSEERYFMASRQSFGKASNETIMPPAARDFDEASRTSKHSPPSSNATM